MADPAPREPTSRKGHLGIWKPDVVSSSAGGPTPAAPGRERIRILARPAAAGGLVREIPSRDLAESIQDEQLVIWIDILHPQGEAASVLRDGLGMVPFMVDDCLTPLRMPKVDILRDGAAFVAAFGVRVEDGVAPRLRAVEVDVVVEQGSLVTVRHGPLEALEERIEAELRSGKDRSGNAAALLAHAALDALVDAHLPVMLRTADIAEQLEEQLDPRSEHSSLAILESLIVLRRDLLAFRRLAVAQQEVLRRLERLAPDVGAYFSDVRDNEREAVDMADATRDYIDGAIEAYRMRRDERVEGGIRRLTILAAILGPLSLLTALFGVNFQNIPGTDYPWGFQIFVVVQLILAALAILYFRRRGLL
jgi:magnesium transporter